MSGYRRQLSDAGALLLSLFVCALFLFASFIFCLPFVVLSPLLLAMTLAMLLRDLVRYPFRKQIDLSTPAPLLLAGWAVALPLAAALAPLLDVAVRAAPSIPSVPYRGKDLDLAVFAGGVGAVTLLASLFVCVRLYRATPGEARFEGELPQKGIGIALLSFGIQVLGMTFSLAGPLGCCLGLLLMTRNGSPGSAAFARAVLWIGAVPAALVGLALIRRAFWVLEIRRLVDDHPRSTVRAAALGLVELHGVARPLDGGHPEAALLLHEDGFDQPVLRVHDFALEDETGRVAVRVPPDARPGVDGVLDLEKRAVAEGHQKKFRLMPGDPVVVLGELVSTPAGREVRPWTPPFGRFLAGLTRDFLDQDWTFAAGIDYGRALGLRLRAEVFAVTDGDESRLRALTRRRWIGSLLAGFALIGGAAVFLARLSA